MEIPKIIVAPSILSADFRKLEKEVKKAEDAGADRIHCDIMDGHFVPNLTFGPMIVEAVKKCVSVPLDVHLMISNPEKYIKDYCNAGADILIVHAEVCKKRLSHVILDIKKNGVKAGACVNPDKSINLLIPYLKITDQVLIMTVFAGFGGQKFITNMLPKIKKIRQEINKINPQIDLEVDGGINGETAYLCALNGANVFVAGNYVFVAKNYKDRISSIKQAALKAWQEKN
jgi:ribulose-phosphate 3-epimerase